MTISSRNPVHSVMWLILAFFNAAGLMVLVGAEFIAMLLVIVYVGAVAVLFLFVVMMLDIDVAEMRAGRRPLRATRVFAIAVALAVEVFVAVGALEHRRPMQLARRAAPIHGRGAQHPGDRQSALHPLPVRVRGRGAGAAGGDDRRDRADPSRTRGGTRYQNVSRQNARRPQDATRNTRPEIGQGVRSW